MMDLPFSFDESYCFYDRQFLWKMAYNELLMINLMFDYVEREFKYKVEERAFFEEIVIIKGNDVS
jgi:hypothetical protein